MGKEEPFPEGLQKAEAIQNTRQQTSISMHFIFPWHQTFSLHKASSTASERTYLVQRPGGAQLDRIQIDKTNKA